MEQLNLDRIYVQDVRIFTIYFFSGLSFSNCYNDEISRERVSWMIRDRIANFQSRFKSQGREKNAFVDRILYRDFSRENLHSCVSKNGRTEGG